MTAWTVIKEFLIVVLPISTMEGTLVYYSFFSTLNDLEPVTNQLRGC